MKQANVLRQHLRLLGVVISILILLNGVCDYIPVEYASYQMPGISR